MRRPFSFQPFCQGFLDRNVFLTDLVTGETRLVSHVPDALATEGASASYGPSISADGRFVAFSSIAHDLTPGAGPATNGTNIFLFDRDTGAVTLASHAYDSLQRLSNEHHSGQFRAVISANGNSIAYTSQATDLVEGYLGTASPPSVYIYNRLTSTNTLASHIAGMPLQPSNYFQNTAVNPNPSISADGRYVVFMRSTTDIIPGLDRNQASGSNAYLYDAFADSITLLDHIDALPTKTGNQASTGVAISADGSTAYFASAGELLSLVVDTNSKSDVFFHETASGNRGLVSFRAPEMPDFTVGGIATESGTFLSDDGRFAVYTSSATNLMAGQVDRPLDNDIFIVDRISGVTQMVTHAPGQPLSSGSHSGYFQPRISGNGQFVTFVTSQEIVYLYDRATQDIKLLTHSFAKPTFASNGESSVMGMSYDGRYIVVASTSTNLLAYTDPNGSDMDVFLYDRVLDSFTLVSHAVGNSTTAGNRTSGGYATISADGATIVFSSYSSDLVAGQIDDLTSSDLFVYDRSTGNSSLVSHRFSSNTLGGLFAWDASTDASGSAVVFTSTAGVLVDGLTHSNGDVFLYDRNSGVVELVSHAANSLTTGGNGGSGGAVLSSDGRYVFFTSGATNLVPGQIDTNGAADVFVYDRAAKTVSLVSFAAGASTTAGAGASRNPQASSDGRVVVFSSLATDLVSGMIDSNNSASENLFRLDRQTGEITLVDHAFDSPLVGANGGIGAFDISVDGEFVAFVSSAENIVPFDYLDGELFLAGPDQIGLGIERAANQQIVSAEAIVRFLVVLDRPILLDTLTPGDIVVGGSTGASVVEITETGPMDGTTFEVAVSGMVQSGKVSVSLPAETVHDIVGVRNLYVLSDDSVVTYDITGPTVTINRAAWQPDPTTAATIHFTAVFSEPIPSDQFTASALSFAGSTATGVLTAIIAGSGTTFDVAVSGMTGSGTVVLSLDAGVVADFAGNLNLASQSTDNNVVYEMPPTAHPQSINATEDIAKDIILTGSSPGGGSLTYTVLTGPTHGSLSGSGANRTYTPFGNYHGPDSFTFKVNDGTPESAPATVSITVAPVDDLPVAIDATFSLPEDLFIVGLLPATDVDNDALTFFIVDPPAHGALSDLSGQWVRYTPNHNYHGMDSFTFQARDAAGSFSNIATIAITVRPVNDAPVAVGDSFATAEDHSLTGTVLGNDSDLDFDSLQAFLAEAHPNVVLNADGTFTYTPPPNFFGPDSFKYRLADGGSLLSNIATVSITVTPTPDAPTAAGQSVTATQNTPKAIVLGPATDVDGETLIYAIMSSPSHGTLMGTGANRTYTPTAGYFGPDGFSFKANDGSTDSNVATVTIDVQDVTAPTVTSVTSLTTNGSYKAGNSIHIQVTFSEGVTVTGTPQLLLETGTVDALASFTNLSGTTLNFAYTIAAGQNSPDLDYVATTSLQLNGGTIRDAATNNANLALPTPGAANSLGANKNLVVDTLAPTVTSVTSSTANGTYKAGDVVAVHVVFSEAVTVSGTPQVLLETGVNDALVNYTSGNSTNTLTFNYTVQAGQRSRDLDYASTTALLLNGGSIRDWAGNNGNLALPAPGVAGSLAANKALVIDTTITTVGVFDSDSATWFLRNSNTAGGPNVSPFAYGFGGTIPVVGDWDGDGDETVGLYYPTTGQWFLRNSNGPGGPDIPVFAYGFGGTIPVVGDWDGDGDDTIGLYYPATGQWFLRNSNGPGAPDIPVFAYGFGGTVPVVGDWDGDGDTNIGLYYPATAQWFLRDVNGPGAPTTPVFAYGFGGTVPVAGDWNSDGRDSIGLYYPGTAQWFLRNSNGAGAPDVPVFAYGFGSNVIVGDWNFPAAPLLATEVGTGTAAMTETELNQTVTGALDRLHLAGADAAVLARLATVRFEVGWLDGAYLGLAFASEGRVIIDHDAAGHGWFIDSTPLDDAEFVTGLAAGRMDLLSAVLHELGHVAGLDHGDGFMAEALGPGTRHLDELDAFFAGH